MRWLVLLCMLFIISPLHAQGPDPADPCEGPAVLVCATLAVPVAIAVIDVVIDVTCPGEAFPPGEWPEDAGVIPFYPEQWLRTECDLGLDDET